MMKFIRCAVSYNQFHCYSIALKNCNKILVFITWYYNLDTGKIYCTALYTVAEMDNICHNLCSHKAIRNYKPQVRLLSC